MLNRSLYTALLYITSPLIFSLLLKNKKGKPPVGDRWKEFLGVSTAIDSNPIWIHAVSVGEVIAATPIVQALQAQYPDQQLLITTTTSTGAERVEALSGNIQHRYFPADYPLAVKQFLKTVKPSVCLIMETELWPNTLLECQKQHIPTVVVNARLSEKSQKKYERFNSLFNQPLQSITKILCQNNDDELRFKHLGLTSEQLAVTGTVKFDIHFSDEIIAQGVALKNQLGNRPTLIASSTHKGEDEIVLAAFALLKQKHPTAVLIIVPRHPERFESVYTLCQAAFPQSIKRSDKYSVQISEKTDIYLADTMGEMPILLAASDVCFMGGSLLGDKVGGHNLLEPAALAKPCLTGPSFYNFADVTEQLLQRKAVNVISNADELAAEVDLLLSDTSYAETMGKNAKSVVEDNAGALDKIMTELSKIITAE